MTKCGSYSGSMRRGNRHPIAEEEVDDGDEDERREQPSPVQPVEQQHTGEKDETHVEVDLLEEGVDLVQPERVDAHVERACEVPIVAPSTRSPIRNRSLNERRPALACSATSTSTP